MSSIVKQKVGNNTYLYESVSYRNEDGRPRNKRTLVGKIETGTGRPLYKPEYLDRMAACGRPVETVRAAPSFSASDIYRSSIRDFGAFYLYRQLAERIGLLGVLQKALPGRWEEAFNLAAYLVSTGDPYGYCEDWLESTEAFPVGPMTSQRISELLASITGEERDNFYRSWCSLRSESEYLALDITSTSSYSQLIDSVEWGYNRDGENLPQINLCLLMGHESGYPVYQSVYGGSLKDVTTLQATISALRAVAGEKPVIVVMDKGFFSRKNINAMLEEKRRIGFVISLPFTSKFAKDMVEGEKEGIDTLSKTIVNGKESLRAVTKRCAWDDGHNVYAHVYYNARKALGLREDLYAYVATLRDRAEAQPEKHADDPEYEKYLDIRRPKKARGKYTIKLREDVVEAELRTAGWMVVVSNCVQDAKEAIRAYREKDVVEKGFLRLKNSLDLGRLRVHSETSMQNKVFVGFVSLILMSAIHKVMVDKTLYGKMTMRKLVLTLSKLKLQMVNGVRILFPVTKEQRSIYEAFDIQEPV